MNKETLLNDFMNMANGRSNEELLPLMLAFSEKAKKENITFTKEDITSIAEGMKKSMNPEDIQKVDAIMKMAAVL